MRGFAPATNLGQGLGVVVLLCLDETVQIMGIMPVCHDSNTCSFNLQRAPYAAAGGHPIKVIQPRRPAPDRTQDDRQTPR